jgi:hypothetical protein
MRQATKDLLIKTDNHLKSLSDQLINELTKIINGDWGLSNSNTSDKVDSLDIEIFTDGYRLVLYPMDNLSTQLGYKNLLESYSGGLLSNIELNPNLDLYDFTSDVDNKDLDEFDKARREIFLEWFVGCWNKTDNKTLNKPICLMFHGMGESLDLRFNKWSKV